MLAELLREYENAALVLDDARRSPVRRPGDLKDCELTGQIADEIGNALRNPTLIDGYGRADAAEKYRLLADLASLVEKYPTEQFPVRLRALAVRFRFLVWTLPFRLPDTGMGAELFQDPSDVLQQKLDRSDALERARNARQEWLVCLAAADNDPWLSDLRAHALKKFDEEHLWLTEQWPKRRGSGPLSLHSTDPGAPGFKADHREVAGRVVELHWLPISDVRSAARAFGPGRLLVQLIPWVPVGCALVAAAALFWPDVDGERWVVGLLLSGLLIGALLLPSGWDALLLLRLPATVAAGTAAVLALTPRWWASPNGWKSAVVVAAAALLYLVLESRLHNEQRWPAVRRGFLVGITGLSYSFLISFVVLGFVAPAVAEHGECLSGLWNQPAWQPRHLTPECTKALGMWPDTQVSGEAAAPAGALLVLTGWSFAIGTALQLLWDDQPVTAPLGRLHRRGGSS
ncbi:hypothetical protein ABT324_09580 [Saccharopolyspora sp. NPDC000359]|uniref:hypothetical protein n=1 Tax=Saccharopolyspora sp. NPDC000359 TaxID=3154251 RepID=UPI00332375E0